MGFCAFTFMFLILLHSRHCLTIKRQFKKFTMKISLNKNIDFEIPKPKYMTVQPSPRKAIGNKLSIQNKKYHDMGIKLRSQYKMLRWLTEDEEITAGKFSFVGKRLELIKKSLSLHLQREPTITEWASASNLDTDQLQLYLHLSMKARKRLVQHNIKIVDYWVRRILEHTQGAKEISYYELVVEGIVGLTKAAENYDGRSRFHRYAQVWVRGEVFRGISSLKPGAMSTHKNIMLSHRARRIKWELQRILSRVPTDEEVASKLNIGVETFRSMRAAASKTMESAQTQLGNSKSTGFSEGEFSNTYFDLNLKREEVGGTNELEDMLWKLDFRQYLNTLSGPEKRTLSIRYGLMDGKRRSIDRTAELMCTSSESVRKILNGAIDKMRQSSPVDILISSPPKDTSREFTRLAFAY